MFKPSRRGIPKKLGKNQEEKEKKSPTKIEN